MTDIYSMLYLGIMQITIDIYIINSIKYITLI